jgi:hypothetical protein
MTQLHKHLLLQMKINSLISDLSWSDADAGRFVTSIDLFFSAKDDELPITVEIRNVVNGYPGPKVYHLVE